MKKLSELECKKRNILIQAILTTVTYNILFDFLFLNQIWQALGAGIYQKIISLLFIGDNFTNFSWTKDSKNLYHRLPAFGLMLNTHFYKELVL